MYVITDFNKIKTFEKTIIEIVHFHILVENI